MGRSRSPRVPPRVRDGRAPRRAHDVPEAARRLMTELVARARLTAPTRPVIGGLLIIERNVMVYRRTLDDPLLRLLRAALLPLLLRLPAAGVHRRRRRSRGEVHRVRSVRRAGAARVVGDERGVLRRDERLLEAALREGVRLDPRDPGRAEGRGGRGDDLGRRARDALLGRVPARDRRARPRRLAVGAPRAARRASSSASASPARGSRRSPGCGRGRTST